MSAPPKMKKMKRGDGLLHDLRQALGPIVVYWIFLVAMFGAFSAAVMVTDPSTGAVGALAIIGFSTAAGVAVGQLMALIRLRDWTIYLFAVVWWSLGFMFSAALGAAAGPLGGALGIVVLLLPFFLTGGLWSLRTGRALFSAWVPLIYASGTAIIVAESRGKVDEWMAGQKWAVWDVFTFGVLVMGIVLLLAFLLVRENHRLGLWRRGPRGPLEGSVAESGAGRPRLTLVGWIMLCGLAFSVAVGAAALAPYLWRTAPDEDGSAQTEQGADGDQAQAPVEPEDPGRERPSSDGEGKQRRRKTRRGAGENSEWVDVREEARPEESGPGGVVLDPLMLLVLALLGLVLGGPPARRLLLVQRLREPSLDTSSTARIEGWWRLMEIGLVDSGLELRPGEPASRLLARAGPVLEAIHPLKLEELHQAAEIRDRVAYGLGVSTADLVDMERLAVGAFDALWDRLGDGAQIQALYRISLSSSADEMAL